MFGGHYIIFFVNVECQHHDDYVSHRRLCAYIYPQSSATAEPFEYGICDLSENHLELGISTNTFALLKVYHTLNNECRDLPLSLNTIKLLSGALRLCSTSFTPKITTLQVIIHDHSFKTGHKGAYLLGRLGEFTGLKRREVEDEREILEEEDLRSKQVALERQFKAARGQALEVGFFRKPQ